MSEPARPALLLIDFINDLDFDDGRRLLNRALSAAERVRDLRAHARRVGMPVIYVNDNFDHWRSNFHEVVTHCEREGSVGRPLVRLLRPEGDEYFVLKPLHSGFYGTTLEVLLRHLRVDTLILTGLATDVCVLFTANDAYLRGFDLYVPRDCTTAVEEEDHRYILRYMERVLKVDIRPAGALIASLGGA